MRFQDKTGMHLWEALREADPSYTAGDRFDFRLHGTLNFIEYQRLSPTQRVHELQELMNSYEEKELYPKYQLKNNNLGL